MIGVLTRALRSSRAHLEAVAIGQHHVEQDHVPTRLATPADRRVTVADHFHLVPVARQIFFET